MMESGAEIAIGVVVEVGIAVTFFGVIYRLWGDTLGLPKPTKILPFQRGVLMKGESPHRLLEPGRHWYSPKRTIFLCDTRPKPFQLNSQDIQSAPHAWIRVSLRGATQIADPAKYVTASSDSLTAFYTELRRILTEAARENTPFLAAEGTEKFKLKLRELLETEAEGFGLTVPSLDVWEVLPLYQQQTEEGDLPSLPVQ